MKLRLLVASLALTSALASAQEPQELTFLTTLSDAPIAAEVVELTENGWISTVDLDMPGQEVSFTATYERGKEELRWTLEVERPGNPVVSATFTAGAVDVEIQPASRTLSFQVDAAPASVFFFENLMWACFIEVGRYLVPLAEKGTLEAGTSLKGILAQHSRDMKVGLTSFEQVEGGAWRFELDLGMTLTCDRAGLPIRVEAPGQRLLALREGAGTEGSVGRTAVDSGPWREELSPPWYEVAFEAGLRVPMRDGVELATDIYRPDDGENRFPVILMRTPYNRKNDGLTNGHRFARRGYVVCVQDVRGRFESGGTFKPLHQETADAYDTLDWLVEQPWCDGNIGMIGGSYGGVVQWYAAKSGHPNLKAIIPQVSPPDPDENFPYEGGVLMLGAAWWAKVLAVMDTNGGAGLPQGVDWGALLQTLPMTDLDKVLGATHPFLDEWVSHPPTDEDYWGPARYQPDIPNMTVSAMHVTGWFDGDQPGALMNFPAMQASARTAEARQGQFLVVGPWGHGFNVSNKLGDVDFGPEAVIDMQALELRFFDRYLKDIDNGIEDEDGAWYFVMGENAWKRAKTWPLPETVYTPLYIGSSGNAHVREGDGVLGLDVGAGGSTDADEYTYDPTDAPEIPDEGWEDVTGQMATMDLRELADRADTLDYTSPPLAAPVELTGPFEVVLWGSTSADDTDFAATIARVNAEGELLAIAAGIQRVRYRNKLDEPVSPGEVVKITIDCWATSIRLEKGERLRVELSSIAFPRYARNLGTLEPDATAKDPVTATNRILHDADHPSHLLLPVVPRKDAPGLVFVE